MEAMLVDCWLDFLSHVQITDPNAPLGKLVLKFLSTQLKYGHGIPTPRTTMDITFNVPGLDAENVSAFIRLHEQVYQSAEYADLLRTMADMGYFLGYRTSEKLLKHITFTKMYAEKIFGKGLSEMDKQKLLAELMESQQRPTGEDIPISEVLLSSTIWNDLDVALLKPAKQVVIDTQTTSEDQGMQMIQEHIERRAKAGPNTKFTFCLFAVSFLSIALVAASNSVRESPYLFRVLWVLAYAINAVTVSIPGRLDRMFKEGNHIKPWHTLFEPACWAFSIWAVIYFTELALSLYVLVVGIPPDLFQMMVPYWLAGNWFQALWCFAFRPEFQKALWVPMGCLLLATLTFGVAHYKITLYMRDMTLIPWCAMMLFRLPIALHTAWLASATLLTLNSWLSVSNAKKVVQIIAAFLSAFAAATLGMVVMHYTQDAVIGLTFAWALDGLACRAHERALLPQGMLASSEIYESLSITETWLSNLLKALSLCVLVGPWTLPTALGWHKYGWKRAKHV